MRLAPCVFLGLMLATADAAAAVVAFNLAPADDEILTTLSVDGFQFTSQHFHLFSDGHFASNGTTHIAYEAVRGSPITMSAVGGGTFSLQGFDGAEAVTNMPGRPPAERIGLVGYRADGTTVSAELVLDGFHDGSLAGSANDFQPFTLSSAFSNLTSVLFYGIRADGYPGGIALDNLNVIGGEPVPGAANCSATSAGRTALNDLGAGTYGGFSGGLYPNGLNVRPAVHEAAGLAAVSGIRPRNSQGQIDDANGHIGFVSIGMGSTSQEFEVFEFDSNVDLQRNPRVTTINGAQSGQSAFQWADPNGAPWTQLATTISNKGLSSSQIQVAWIELAIDGSDVGGWNSYAPFPAPALALRAEVREVVRNLKSKYPNVKVAYLSSRIYGGYATNGLFPEPVVYEDGFGIKWLIEDQINGDPGLNYSGGSAEAPFLAWGPYLWANGLGSDGIVGGITGRSDGLEYSCQDFAPDGMNPSASGRHKVADQLGQFLKTDNTARLWYLDPNPPPANGNPYFADLDGADDYLQAADSNGLSFGNGSVDTPLTLELWIRPDGMVSKQNLIGKWQESSNTEYRLYIAANAIRLDLRDVSTQATVAAATASSLIATLAGSWHHLAVVYDGRGGSTAANGITFYLDGVVIPVARLNNAAYVAMENGTATLQIGREGVNWKQYNGAIDDVRLWRVARTQSQIQAQMTSELGASELGLAAYWKFNEGTGTTVADSSSSGNTATMFNGPTWLTGGPVGP